MSESLQIVWQAAELLLNNGINIIPVRDKEEAHNGKVYGKKTPYKDWAKYQLEFIDRQELFNQLEKFNTTAIAMVCGAISGNLEIIDVDVKYLPGIDARLFGDLKELYPDLLAKLRIHKTPSGGCHIIYRIEDGYDVPGNMHLAIREATEEELLVSPKRKTYCFLETRGTGGLCTSPPCLGYSVRKDVPIPVLTWGERCTLIELCRSYNQYIKPEKPYTPNKAEAAYYDESPFEHYNRTVDPVELLTNCGWTMVANRGGFIRFTKPGGKKGDVHGSFDTAKRVFHMFSSNADLEGDRAYNLSSILAYYQFGDDKKRAYQWLVEAGYGRIKPAIERRIVQRAATAGQPLPANVSDEGRQQHLAIAERLTTQHPHGIFWEFGDDDEVKISRERLYAVAEAMGFRYYQDSNEVVQVVDIFIYRRNEREFYDLIKAYIHDDDGDILEDICNAYEAFIEKHGKFSMQRLKKLETELILHDTRFACYKCYQNGVVVISRDGYDLVAYDSFNEYLIWAEKIQPRDFLQNNGGGLFTEFLNLAVDYEFNKEYIQKCIGWLAHDYKDTSTAYIIVMTEKCADPKDGGGSGKNLLCNMLAYTTTYISTPGRKDTNGDINMLQCWNGQRIFAISDARKDFDFETLKEPSSGNMEVKKLWKDRKILANGVVPKFIVQTNFSFEISDGGLRRRVIPIEFTNFFTNCGGVDVHFSGKQFPMDWSTIDWADYDTFICESIRYWISCNLKLKPNDLSNTGWEKQFVMEYGITCFEFIKENFDSWVSKDGGFISIQDFNTQLNSYYEENNIKTHKPTIFTINKALKEWSEKNGFLFEKNYVKNAGYGSLRGRLFSK